MRDSSYGNPQSVLRFFIKMTHFCSSMVVSTNFPLRIKTKLERQKLTISKATTEKKHNSRVHEALKCIRMIN